MNEHDSKLSELRNKWETDLHVCLITTDVRSMMPMDKSVYIVLREDRPPTTTRVAQYRLHRYFYVREWQCSVDLKGATLQACLDGVTNEYKDRYPKDFDRVASLG